MSAEGRAGTLRWMRSPKALFGLTVVVTLVGMRLYALLVSYDPVADLNAGEAFLGMVPGHPLGTDHLGRDLLKRLIFSTEAFFVPGLMACGVAAVGGVLGGAVAGFYGGAFAAIFRYINSLVVSFPRFVLILLVLSITGEGIYVMAVATGIIYVPIVGESVFRKVQHFRTTEFIEAARAHGLKDSRVLIYHILYHNCMAPIGRHLIYLFGYVILVETSLSYLGGFGRQEPNPSWGNMVAAGRDYIFQGELLFVLVPAVAIGVTILGLAMLGDALGELEEGA